MSFAALEKIADAVLFEGYILYPYRPSSIKNLKRWNFGTLFSHDLVMSEMPNEPWYFHAEVLVRGAATTKLTARIRFLELVNARNASDQTWQQGFDRTRDIEATLDELCHGVDRCFDLAELTPEEEQRAPASRDPRPMMGRLSIHAEFLHGDVFRISTEFANESPASGAPFVSAHLLMHVEGGAFVSLLEPHQDLEATVSLCRQQGVFPVLAGEPGDRSSLLCSPIILYDYPQVAPESAGDFFDSTEMDEMLSLRVMTLTDDEKNEIRQSDPFAKAILDRTETLSEDQLLKSHGVVRSMRIVPSDSSGVEIDGRMEAWDPFIEKPPVEVVQVFGVDVRKGDRVRLWPQKKADIMDMVMEGKIAIVEAIEQDLEDQVQFAVVLEDDPGRDMGMLRQAGHRFFFSPEEIEPMTVESSQIRNQL